MKVQTPFRATPHKDCASDAPSDFLSDCAKNRAGRLSPVKGFLCKMTENMQADDVQNRQMFFVRRCLSILTRLEWILWGCSLLVVTLSFLLSGGGVLSLIASLIGVTALIFLAKGHVLGQILTVVFSVLYGMISWRFHYYGEMLTYLGMTMPIAAWSVYTWLKHPYAGTKEVAVRRLSGGKFLLLLLVTLLVTIGAFFLLWFWNTPNLLASTLSIATSFLAASLALLRSPYYAIAYSCNDIVLIVLWILAAIDSVSCLPMVFCFGMFLLNDIYGFVSWRRMERRQATAPTDSHTARKKS